MAIFVLVHGAWHGGWCYNRVTRLLRERGHDVFTPTLTGLGERSHLSSPDISLETHIQDVINVIRYERLENVLICGHSYAGMVISGVASAIPEKIAGLVYIDAFIPKHGQSLLDQLPLEYQLATLHSAKVNGGFVPPMPAIAYNANPADIAWIDEACVAQPINTFQQAITLSGEENKVANLTYVFASGWKSELYEPTYRRLSSDPKWRTVEVDCGHEVMLDRPNELAKHLIEGLEPKLY